MAREEQKEDDEKGGDEGGDPMVRDPMGREQGHGRRGGITGRDAAEHAERKTVAVALGRVAVAQPAQVLLQIATTRYRARPVSVATPSRRSFSLPALARVNLQQRPATTAFVAATSGAQRPFIAHRARGAVRQQRLHVAAVRVGGGAGLVVTAAGVDKQLHVQLDRARAVSSRCSILRGLQLGTPIGDVEGPNLSQEHRSIAQMSSLPLSQ
jgi:hypothetical protein